MIPPMPAPAAPVPVPAQDIADRLARGEKLTLLDVREHDEVAICHIEASCLK